MLNEAGGKYGDKIIDEFSKKLVIEVGKKADIIAINMDKPHLFPALDIPNLIVYSMQGSDVCMTMVDGEILYEDGKFFTIDKEKTLEEVEVVIRRLFNN